ncbi:hypothetical protein MKW98_015826 [Papaver atlanticum]|uniref:Uncharacterized protein n=1 Tax=Papaver atlanticum TaxID=357466 RepID=A0AAD4XVX7_9MAGN|nr:hypothetical protein MKW98_015826 [Papaver atlanticum]
MSITEDHQSDRESVGSEIAPYSGPNRGFSTPEETMMRSIHGGQVSSSSRSRSYTNNNDGNDLLDVTFTISRDSVAVLSVDPVNNVTDLQVPDQPVLLSRALEKIPLIGSSIMRSASAKMKQISERTASVFALEGLRFISKTEGSPAGWMAVKKRFVNLTALTDGRLHRSQFYECIGTDEKDSKKFALELFDALARRKDIRKESLNENELRVFWEELSNENFDSRLQTFFAMIDKDADGRIKQEEIEEIITLSASTNKLLKIGKEQAKEYALFIMELLDPDNSSYIMVEDLKILLLQSPRQMVRGDISEDLSKDLSEMLNHNKLKHAKKRNPVSRLYQSNKHFFSDNWQRIWVFTLWLVIVFGLFIRRFIQYRNKAVYDIMGYCVCTAKGAGETLKFNMALILLPVCRNTITWLRKTKLGAVIPFDDNINFHKVMGIGIAMWVALHAVPHLACGFPRLIHVSNDEYKPMKPFFGEDKPENYWLLLKGVEGVSGIFMVVFMAIAFTFATTWFRRSRITLPWPFTRLIGFNTFWYSHHLFYHCIRSSHLQTWMYLAVPVTLNACERLTRALRSSINPVKIRKIVIYPGNVLTVHTWIPQGFKYKSGQYMFIKCPDVSPFEWHPFSITSAPAEDYLSVHIQTVGDWSRQLKTVLSQVCHPSVGNTSGIYRADLMPGTDEANSIRFPVPEVLIDGPYGAPAQDYLKYEVVLLVRSGIGATPMISIIKDIVNKMEAEDIEALETTKKNKRKRYKTKKAYFYWITREQNSFDSFKGVMNEVVEMDTQNIIEIHNHCTSVYERDDARSAVIAMLQSLNHAVTGVDVVAGTHVKSHFGRPNWSEVYKTIAVKHKGSQFDFHKENFKEI